MLNAEHELFTPALKKHLCELQTLKSLLLALSERQAKPDKGCMWLDPFHEGIVNAFLSYVFQPINKLSVL